MDIIWSTKMPSRPISPPVQGSLRPYFPCPPILDIPGSRQTKLSPPPSPKMGPRIYLPPLPVNIPSSSPALQLEDPIRRLRLRAILSGNVGHARLETPIPCFQTREAWEEMKTEGIVVNLAGLEKELSSPAFFKLRRRLALLSQRDLEERRLRMERKMSFEVLHLIKAYA
jgi:hypothetical protein